MRIMEENIAFGKGAVIYGFDYQRKNNLPVFLFKTWRGTDKGELTIPPFDLIVSPG